MAARIALFSFVPSRLSCPRPSGERAQWCSHQLERVRGLTPPHPSSRLDAVRCPLPQWGEGTITTTALAASACEHRRAVGVSCFTISNSALFFLPATRSCARVLLLFRTRPQTEGRAERREAHMFRCRAGEARRASGGTRSPHGAPPWRFSARGPRSPSPALPPDPVRERPRRQRAWPARDLDLPHPRLRATATGRHSPLRLQDRL